MKKEVKKRQKLSLIFNLIIVILEMYSVFLSFGKNGLKMFMFYTEDSNIFSLIVCFILVILTFVAIKNNKSVSSWIITLKYMATCCLAVTFIVVLFILAPMYGPNGYKIMLFDGSMLYHHLLCPVLAIISFIFFDSPHSLNFKSTLYAIVPTICYATITIIFNIFKIIEGPYPFLLVYKQPIYMSVIWCVLIIGGAYFIAYLLKSCSKLKINKN